MERWRIFRLEVQYLIFLLECQLQKSARFHRKTFVNYVERTRDLCLLFSLNSREDFQQSKHAPHPGLTCLPMYIGRKNKRYVICSFYMYQEDLQAKKAMMHKCKKCSKQIKLFIKLLRFTHLCKLSRQKYINKEEKNISNSMRNDIQIKRLFKQKHRQVLKMHSPSRKISSKLHY